MFGINSLKRIGKGIFALSDGLSKFNQTIHGSTDAAAKAANITKTTGSLTMTAKGVKDCVVTYQCNDLICFTVSAVGTTADVGNLICGNMPGLKQYTPLTTSISGGCKYFVHVCQTGDVTWSCKDKI